MNTTSIINIAMMMLGQTNIPNSVKNNPNNNKADIKLTPLETIVNGLLIPSIKAVFGSYCWSFLRFRQTLSYQDMAIVAKSVFSLIGKEEWKEVKEGDVVNVKKVARRFPFDTNKQVRDDHILTGAAIQYVLPSDYQGYLHVYDERWETIIDYTQTRTKTWWINRRESDNSQELLYLNSILYFFNSDKNSFDLNIEYSKFANSNTVNSYSSISVPSYVEMCIAYHLAHLACVAVTGSSAEAVRLFQLYSSSLEQGIKIDNKNSTPPQVISLSDKSSNRILNDVVHYDERLRLGRHRLERQLNTQMDLEFLGL